MGSVGRVTLTLADGTQITDDGESGVVLFVGRTGGRPATVDIFDDHGDRSQVARCERMNQISALVA
jgi:hypothetical protein